ncbi:esterase/lipase family protein [Candidatus Amarolinea aalborgensis]|uniref:esterase/lipase family protein n=1 Tax=Candidatus Amarolinea aalborgensis TaxID=2249329 RepID=UPI003BF983B6
MPNQQPSSPPVWAAWMASLTNGLVGDHLHASQNGLAIDMAFYHLGRPLPLTAEAVLTAHPQPTSRLCILVHGLSCHEGIWLYPDPANPGHDTSYGALLQQDFGYTPFFVRYNTGLALADNGARLAALLDDLMACYPMPVEDILLIGHSMGGLILRSACHIGAQQRAAWVMRVSQVFYLGTPHEGARLARLGQATTAVLHAVPHPITRLLGNVLDVWSQGVKDLRLTQPLTTEAGSGDAAEKGPMPWLPHARHHLIVGALTEDPRQLATRVLGDGLVAVPAVHPRRQAADASAPATDDSLTVLPHTHHLQLTRDPAVYAQIKQCCADGVGQKDEKA